LISSPNLTAATFSANKYRMLATLVESDRVRRLGVLLHLFPAEAMPSYNGVGCSPSPTRVVSSPVSIPLTNSNIPVGHVEGIELGYSVSSIRELLRDVYCIDRSEHISEFCRLEVRPKLVARKTIVSLPNMISPAEYIPGRFRLISISSVRLCRRSSFIHSSSF